VTTVRFVDEKEYRSLASSFELHFLQSPEWGNFKERHGWQPFRLAVFTNAECIGIGQYLKRRLTSRYAFAYFPKGPSCDYKNCETVKTVFSAINEFIMRSVPEIVFVRYEPDICEAVNGQTSSLEFPRMLNGIGMKKSPADIQYRDTRKLPLSTESETWDSFTSKQRNKIKIASKKDVEIKRVQDVVVIDEFFSVYKETAERNNIFIHPISYYREFFTTFVSAGSAEFYGAYFDGEMLAGAFIVHYGKESIYMYSGSCDKERNRRPNEAMQWEAIAEAIRRGSTVYDFWGVAPLDEPNHPWAGLSEFKAGFGGDHIRYIGCYDHPCKSFLYIMLTFAEKARKILLTIKKKLRRR